jgi:signal transduction histidine kinase
LFWSFVAIRCAHIGQGVVCMATSMGGYRRPRLVGLTLAAAAAESGWLVRRARRLGGIDRACARVDGLFCLAGIGTLALATTSRDRTSSMNWMLPYSVAACLGFPMGMPLGEGSLSTAVLGSAYLTSCLPTRLGGRPGDRGAAVANAANYVAFFSAAAVCVRFCMQMADLTDTETEQALLATSRVASLRERNQQHRLLHDRALQTLEAIAKGWVTDNVELRRRAARDATAFRQALQGDQHRSGTLQGALESVVEEMTGYGLAIELVTDVHEEEPTVPVIDALEDATREALRNVYKHAGVTRVVVRVVVGPASMTVTIRDQGVGFEPDDVTDQYGIKACIRERLADVGGKATIWSAPGRGVRVELEVPR